MDVPLTWRCEVCRRERPDEHIAVTKHRFSDQITRNVRHCSDNQLCIRAAADVDRWALGVRSGNEARVDVTQVPRRPWIVRALLRGRR